jgi:hypothetical protein
MASGDNNDVTLALAKLILCADHYAGINPSMARFYLMEANKLRNTAGLPPVSRTVVCTYCWSILRPETCYVSLLAGVKNRADFRRLAATCRRKLKSKRSKKETVSVALRCLTCKRRSVELCTKSKPQKTVKSGAMTSKKKVPVASAMKTATTAATSRQLSEHCATQPGKQTSSLKRVSNSVDPKKGELSERCAPKPSKQSTSKSVPNIPGPMKSEPNNQGPKKSTNKKKDTKLKHNVLQNILRTERENRLKSSADCLRQFFSFT